MTPTPQQKDSIARLIDKYKELQQSPRNLGRANPRRGFSVGMEAPMCWVRVFGLDVERYFSDPFYYLECELKHRLWMFENLDDCSMLGDSVNLMLSMYAEYTFVGLSCTLDALGVPQLQTDHPLSRTPDLSLLKPVDFCHAGLMPQIMEWHKILVDFLDGRMKLHVSDWGRGCLDIAIQFRGYDNFIMDTYERPEFVHGLLKWLVDERCKWFAQYYKYFDVHTDVCYIGDDWINIPFITPRFFEEFLLPRYLEIEAFHGNMGNVHSCGNQLEIQKYLLQMKTLRNVEISPWTDMAQTVKNIPTTKRLGVGIHPNDVLFTTPQKIEEHMKKITELCAHHPYGVGTSGLTPITGSDDDFIRRVRVWTDMAHKYLF